MRHERKHPGRQLILPALCVHECADTRLIQGISMTVCLAGRGNDSW